MYNICIKILFCIMSSIISSEFYIALSGKKTPRIIMPIAIFASHMIIFLPFYDKYEILLDTLQIIIEFIIILIIIDGKLVQKLLMYVELNVAFGAAAILCMGFKENKILYCLGTLTVAMIICFLILKFQCKSKNTVNGVRGRAISFSLCVAMLCLLYTVGLVITELEYKMTIVIYCSFIFVIFIIYELLLINARIKKYENTLIRYVLVKRMDRKLSDMKDDVIVYLSDKMRRFDESQDILQVLYESLYDLYDVRDKIVEDKSKIAKELGCEIQVTDISPSFWGGIKPAKASAVMFNLMDNALEAVAKNKQDNRYIKITYANQRLIIENPYEEQLHWENGELVTSKKGGEHGLGLENVRRMLREPYGRLDINADNGIFRVEVRF